MYAPSTQGAGRVPDTPRRLPLDTKIADYSVITLAILFGVGSIVLFAWPDRPAFVPLGLSPVATVWWNTLLSFVFFAQHSVLVRRAVRARLAVIIPPRYDGAFYAITSGIALAVVAVLLQPAAQPLFVLKGLPRLAVTTASLLAVAGFAWGVCALRTFDLLGLRPIRAHLRGDSGRSSETERPVNALVVRGPYRWVRHPLYTCVIVLLWANPVVSLDRLVLAGVWTTWIVVGALLEERDLISDFGDAYRQYRAQVPILIPWRGRVVVQSETASVLGQQTSI
jgi:protein-S-isoprenylcysteine O-methyltransferase Ste14